MEVTFAKDFTIGEFHWNHRVVRRVYHAGTDHEEVVYAIHEAYYETKGASSGPCSITTEPKGIVGDNVEDLRETLQQMLKALDNPVLDYETREEIAPKQ